MLVAILRPIIGHKIPIKDHPLNYTYITLFSGTRFRPLSLDVPQPLFPIAGVPLLQHHIEACSKLEDIKEIILLGMYQQSRDMTRFIQDMQQMFNIPIR